MIILNRKRLIAMLSMVCVSIFAFTFQIAKKEETTETVALPVTNKIIVVDARTPGYQMKGQKVAQGQQKHRQI